MERNWEIDDGQILEGFLCPICRADLKTPERLTDHVENNHAEEQDTLKFLKDIFSKTRKILNFDETLDLAKSIDNNLKVNVNIQANVFNGMVQTVGADCNHFSYFSSIRTPRLDRYANETNKLIIRLNKLLKDRPSDPIQQKLHDQKTVPWIEGASVKLCPSCAKSFHIARRQHHCRLCGSIMCNDCSQFLPLREAAELVNGVMSVNEVEKKLDSKSDTNLNTIRVCDHCLHLLDARKEMQDSRTYRPPITSLYDDIQNLKKESFPDIEMYEKMISSLQEGESIYTVNDVSTLRGKIGHLAELIDVKSKRILAIPTQEGCREEALKKAIRIASIQFIKENMLSISKLPVEEEIKKLQEKRRRETEQNIERERRLAQEAFERYGLVDNSIVTNSPAKESFASASGVTTLDNWTTHQSNSFSDNVDPLIEQINIIKGYIKQARSAMRFNEVETLEINLRELQHELYFRQQNNK
ncbi:rabenosyn-5 [Condylostylus longicornis]|uniref:rabenosyn-5 n=1 Tax=Condylostylus longicornis TaxID=2530218 RepID=UPI00244DE331|nr:rabenosyn-5 [Condylostylus longicornis]